LDENTENIMKLPEIVSEIKKLLDSRDYEGLHKLEHKIIELSIINYNKDYSELCVVIFTLRKLISKAHIYDQDDWKKSQLEIDGNLDRAIKEFKDEDHSSFNNIIKNILFIIEKADNKLGRYVTHIVDEARIKLASDIYAYGLSASQAAELVSANRAQLMQYIGVTKMPDEDKEFKSIGERVHLLEVASKSDVL